MEEHKGKWSIPTRYNSIDYRSRLEASWAEWFDNYRIVHVYESEGFNIDSIYYLPDFYLPELKTIFEVKGVLDTADMAKLKSFAPLAAKHAITTILGYSRVGESLAICRPTPQQYFSNPYVISPREGPPIWSYYGDNEFRIENTIQVAKCRYCGHVFFCDMLDWFGCQYCGKSDGNHHIMGIDEYWDVWLPQPGELTEDKDCPI